MDTNASTTDEVYVPEVGDRVYVDRHSPWFFCNDLSNHNILGSDTGPFTVDWVNSHKTLFKTKEIWDVKGRTCYPGFKWAIGMEAIVEIVGNDIATCDDISDKILFGF